MITPSFGLTATERVLPRLALDWTTGLPQDGVDVVRADVATFVGSNSLIQSASANTQRVDYSSGVPALLVEETRTNLNTYSNGSYVNGSNGYVNSGTLATTVAGIDGTVNAQQFTFGSGSVQNVYKIFAVSASTAYAFSFYYQLGTYPESNFRIAFRDDTNGAFISTDIVPTKTLLSNGWVRATHTVTTPVGCLLLRCYMLRFTPSTAGTIAFDGVQLEAGATVTSYIPTTTVAVTRNADVPTMTGTNFSDWYKAGSGTIVVKVSQRSISGIRPIVQLDDTTTDNFIVLRGNAANPELYIKATTDQAQIDAGTIAANTAYRLAGSWAANSVAASVNSGTPVLDGSATIPTVTQMRIGSDGTNYLNGWIESIEYYDQQLFPSNLQLLSASKGNRSVINTVMTSVAGSVINRVIT